MLPLLAKHHIYILHKSVVSVQIKYKSKYAFYGNVATLGLFWDFSLAENLASLILQDRPQSCIIFRINHPTHPPDNLDWKSSVNVRTKQIFSLNGNTNSWSQMWPSLFTNINWNVQMQFEVYNYNETKTRNYVLWIKVLMLCEQLALHWFRRQVLTIVITDFRSSLLFFFFSLSSTSIAFDPLRRNSRGWNFVSPNILA